MRYREFCIEGIADMDMTVKSWGKAGDGFKTDGRMVIQSPYGKKRSYDPVKHAADIKKVKARWPELQKQGWKMIQDIEETIANHHSVGRESAAERMLNNLPYDATQRTDASDVGFRFAYGDTKTYWFTPGSDEYKYMKRLIRKGAPVEIVGDVDGGIDEGEVVGFAPKSNSKAADDIAGAEYTGNAYSDGELMQKIHCFIMDKSNSMEDKMRALSKLDDIMGLDQGDVTPRDVQLYMQNEDPPEEGECADPEPFVPYPDAMIPGKGKPNLKIVK